MGRAGRLLFSPKSTIVVLLLLLGLLFLNVLLPQERVVGEETIRTMVHARPLLSFFFETLGLSHITTSAPFLLLLALFYLQLLAYLGRFIRVTLRRIRHRPSRWERWARLEMRQIPEKNLFTQLGKMGFRVEEMQEGKTWAVRNRISPLGFILFHVSFLLFLSGGLLLHATRCVFLLDCAVEQSVQLPADGLNRVIRQPLVKPPSHRFTLTLRDVEAVREGGEPMRLRTRLRFDREGSQEKRDAGINRPASFMGYLFYPDTTDTAFVVQRYDDQGFLVETAVLFSKIEAGRSVTARLASGGTITIPGDEPAHAVVTCEGHSDRFGLQPGRRMITSCGEFAVLSRVPWVTFRVVHEHGGGLLILGFCLAIAGLVFRLLFPRQDLIIEGKTLYYRGDYFPRTLRESLSRLPGGDHDDS